MEVACRMLLPHMRASPHTAAAHQARTTLNDPWISVQCAYFKKALEATNLRLGNVGEFCTVEKKHHDARGASMYEALSPEMQSFQWSKISQANCKAEDIFFQILEMQF